MTNLVDAFVQSKMQLISWGSSSVWYNNTDTYIIYRYYVCSNDYRTRCNHLCKQTGMRSVNTYFLKSVYRDAVFCTGPLFLFNFCGAALFAFHTWMRRVQKAHKHSCQPYLLCAQVIAVIFLIQLRLICMGGGIDPRPHVSVPHLLLRKHSRLECAVLKCHSHH